MKFQGIELEFDDPEVGMTNQIIHPRWAEDCQHWRGKVLTGRYCHWCFEYDDLPVDETTPEWPCACAPDLVKAAGG